MSELLQEFVDSGSERLRVDRAAGVIRGVKLLGLQSRNGRRYREQALAEAAALYEGARVNVNHPKGHPLSPRDYQDRLGVIRGVALRTGEGLFGDLHFNPKHALSEQLIWDAEHASQNVGLSHNVLARTSRDGDETTVEAITKVQSIDVVADPATTRGLFEHEATTAADDEVDVNTSAIEWQELTVEQLRRYRPDLLQEVKQAQEALLEEARAQRDELVARESTQRRRGRILELLHEHGLPTPDAENESARRVVSERFMESLMNAPDDRSLRQLIEDRAALVRSARQWQGEAQRSGRPPVSRDQVLVAAGTHGHAINDAKEFAAAVRGR
jgi:hypothetical protein